MSQSARPPWHRPPAITPNYSGLHRPVAPRGRSNLHKALLSTNMTEQTLLVGRVTSLAARHSATQRQQDLHRRAFIIRQVLKEAELKSRGHQVSLLPRYLVKQHEQLAMFYDFCHLGGKDLPLHHGLDQPKLRQVQTKFQQRQELKASQRNQRLTTSVQSTGEDSEDSKRLFYRREPTSNPPTNQNGKQGYRSKSQACINQERERVDPDRPVSATTSTRGEKDDVVSSDMNMGSRTSLRRAIFRRHTCCSPARPNNMPSTSSRQARTSCSRSRSCIQHIQRISPALTPPPPTPPPPPPPPRLQPELADDPVNDDPILKDPRFLRLKTALKLAPRSSLGGYAILSPASWPRSCSQFSKEQVDIIKDKYMTSPGPGCHGGGVGRAGPRKPPLQSTRSDSDISDLTSLLANTDINGHHDDIIGYNDDEESSAVSDYVDNCLTDSS